MADITPQSTTTAQGSQTPVENSFYPGWPDAPEPGVDACGPMNFDGAGDTTNILGGGSAPSSSYALGKNRPD